MLVRIDLDFTLPPAGELAALAAGALNELESRGLSTAMNEFIGFLGSRCHAALLKALAGSSPARMPATVLSIEARALAEAGHKIPAIRNYRERSGASLRAAKEAVEEWMEYARRRRAELVLAVLAAPLEAELAPASSDLP